MQAHGKLPKSGLLAGLIGSFFSCCGRARLERSKIFDKRISAAFFDKYDSCRLRKNNENVKLLLNKCLTYREVLHG